MDLGELISLHKGDRSYATLERDCGGAPKAARLQQLATAPIRNFPDPPTIRALARGLRVSERSVVLASASSLGLDVAGSDVLSDRMPPGVRGLSEDQLGTVVDVVRRLVEANERSAWTDSFQALLVDERAQMLGADGKPITGDARARVAREVAEELADDPRRLRQLAKDINDLVMRTEKEGDGNADNSSSTSTGASVTTFPKKGTMIERATKEAEAARGSGGKGRNRTSKPSPPVKGFNPDDD